MTAHPSRHSNEHDRDLFEYGAVLPTQLCAAVRDPSHGERRLMAAVLADAIDCFQKYLHTKESRHQQLFRQTEKWLLGASTRWIFSFESICEVLDLDANHARASLEHWRERQLQRAGASAEAAPAARSPSRLPQRQLGDPIGMEVQGCRFTSS